MKDIHVLVVWPIRPAQLAQLEQTYTAHRYDQATPAEKAAMIQQVGDRIRAVVTTHGGGFEKNLLDQLPNLEIVACASVGYDTLCVKDCQARGIPVTNTPDVLTDDVADMAMLLMLATLRRFLPAVDWIKQGDWVSKGMMPLNTAVRGKTLGIVGLGRIGKAIATRAEAFGMSVSYYNRSPKSDVPYRYYDDLHALANDVDVLMPMVPGGTDTQGLISRSVLEALGANGYFINVSRGSVVDETALVELLQQRAIAGAGLDVFTDEPNVPSALLELDNVALQPHCASGTFETRAAMAQLVLDNLEAHFSGKPLLTVI
ncbi:2-hydroxyacid dehydrogenase [Maribrevibacterium harenarium]|uniref:2-hydroxyacid dehydrogenase n=1 Tax=Maribrevibacterium harenarium TaxID=2589817 RepID=A0A501WHL6_9GAMM|nr:2-hydroxyacid dehydrogenase [Maribrevibacterium harenarium]TPE49019.1 2-hydroxyacid dehydrogenase [Maribrevibacterium harenarium]